MSVSITSLPAVFSVVIDFSIHAWQTMDMCPMYLWSGSEACWTVNACGALLYWPMYWHVRSICGQPAPVDLNPITTCSFGHVNAN